MVTEETIEKPAPKPPPVGIHYDMPAAQYHERILGVASKGALDLVARSPAHYKAWIDGVDDEEDDRAAFAIGKAFHCAALEPGIFATTYVSKPDFGDCRFKENKAKRDEWNMAHAGFEVLEEEAFDRVCAMSRALREHKDVDGNPSAIQAMLRGGKSEVTVGWTDDATGLPCKARADYFKEGRKRILVDLKSTTDARREHARAAVSKYRYHVQAAHYTEGFAAVGKPVDAFIFVFVEKRPPYGIKVFTLDASVLQKAYLARAENMNTLAECMKTNRWPGYSPDIEVLDLPPWG